LAFKEKGGLNQWYFSGGHSGGNLDGVFDITDMNLESEGIWTKDVPSTEFFSMQRLGKWLIYGRNNPPDLKPPMDIDYLIQRFKDEKLTDEKIWAASAQMLIPLFNIDTGKMDYFWSKDKSFSPLDLLGIGSSVPILARRQPELMKNVGPEHEPEPVGRYTDICIDPFLSEFFADDQDFWDAPKAYLFTQTKEQMEKPRLSRQLFSYVGWMLEKSEQIAMRRKDHIALKQLKDIYRRMEDKKKTIGSLPDLIVHPTHPLSDFSLEEEVIKNNIDEGYALISESEDVKKWIGALQAHPVMRKYFEAR